MLQRFFGLFGTNPRFFNQCFCLTLFGTLMVLFTFYGLSGNNPYLFNPSLNEIRTENDISSLKSVLKALKNEVIIDRTKIEELQNQIKELKQIQSNIGGNDKEQRLLKDDDDEDEGIPAEEKTPPAQSIHSSRNKAAVVYQELHKTQKPKSDSNGGNSCPARKLFYSNEGDIQMLHAYEIIPFDDKFGGVWAQGFEITYDKEKIKQEEPLEVYVVPHSHNDPGWWYTFEGYYDMYSNDILTNIIKYLNTWDDIKFIYSEMSFLELWWKRHSEEDRKKMKDLIQKGKLEIPTGAWVMTDEANAHLYSIVTEMFEGHEFLMNTIGVRPKNHWSIDPFGLSPTVSYLLRQANITNLAINRVHYAVKKFLAETKDLEFHWRQLWAGKSDKTDVFTHMFPFGGYDIPSTCGPDKKICCTFDFRRIGGNGCDEYGTKSVSITDDNIQERSTTLADQYRKKAQLFKTNVILVPLGEDFRWNWDSEWNAHHSNYIKLFNYMNDQKDWNMKVKFGTLEDYFEAVKRRIKPEDIKTLSGDFFTYADYADHYWSGYYTSRPFYKHMDRTVQHYVKAADIAYASWLWKSISSGVPFNQFPGASLYDLLVTARRHLSVFQHHDGVTGTAKNDVVMDYARKMLEAIENCQKIITSASNALSGSAVSSNGIASVQSTVDEIYTFDRLPTKKVFSQIGKSVSLFNSLPYDRQELICIVVTDTTFGVAAAIEDNKETIEQEIYPYSPLFNASLILPENLYELCFIAKVPAFGFKSYKLIKKDDQKLATVSANFETGLKKFTVVKHNGNEALKAPLEFNDDRMKVSLDSANGFVKTITFNDDEETTIDLHFIQYGAREHFKNWSSPGPAPNSVSGSYLFLPDGPAKALNIVSTKLLIVKGVLKQQIIAQHSTVIPLLQVLTLKKDDNFIEVKNLVDIRSTDNFELGMRIKSNVKGDNFFSDLNGYQMIRRRRFKEKLPIQAHFYPMPSSAFIEDDKQRITLLGRQAGGVASLEPGWLEVMLDRRLSEDDNRGLNQGLNDNLLTQSSFYLSVEKFAKSASSSEEDTTIGYHSLASQHASLRLHSPVIVMESSTNSQKSFSILKSSLPCDVYTLSLRPLSAPTIYSKPNVYVTSPTNASAIILQRFGAECSLKTPMTSATSCPMESSSADSSFDLNAYLSMTPSELQSISLTMLYEGEKASTIELEPMEIKSLKITF